MIGRWSGIVAAAAAASFLSSAQGWAQSSIGQTIQPAANDSTSGTTPVTVAGATIPGLPTSTGALSQTTTMPGTAPEASAVSATVPPPMVLGTPATPPAQSAASAITTIPQGAAAVVKAEVRKFIFHSPAEKARYDRAASLFPSFCKDWQRMLRDRETNNLQHLTWQTRDGYQTTTYTGYGQVESCETKESVEGVPIGKISYEEMVYYLTGKTPDEARHAAPKLIHQTRTLEIFSWEKDKWFY